MVQILKHVTVVGCLEQPDSDYHVASLAEVRMEEPFPEAQVASPYSARTDKKEDLSMLAVFEKILEHNERRKKEKQSKDRKAAADNAAASPRGSRGASLAHGWMQADAQAPTE